MRMLSLLCCAVLLAGCDRVKERFSGPKTDFDGNAALAYVKTHLEVGPRIPGTPAHEKAADWIVAEMKKRTDSVTEQRWTQTTANGTKLEMRNILARFNPAATSRVLYVTHWDTKPTADDDPNFGNRARPFPGANDGAAGVGLFIALGDVFKKTPPSVGVDLLFVDGEDWGSFNSDSSGMRWPDALFGSQYFAAHPPTPDYKPMFGIVFDMIGDADLQLWQEGTSIERAPEVVSRVWRTAKELGYGDYFRDQPMNGWIDDHLPLIAKGWHVIEVFDSQYGVLPPNAGPNDTTNPNYHHTMQDTFDKLSAKSLQIVGDVAVALVK